MSSVHSTATLHHSIPLFKGKAAHRSWPQLPEELVRSVISYAISKDRILTVNPGLSRTITCGTSQLPAIVHLLGMLANCGIPGWSIHVYATRSNWRKASCPSVQNGAERVSALFLLFSFEITPAILLEIVICLFQT
jgi:hypothetical protein